MTFLIWVVLLQAAQAAEAPASTPAPQPPAKSAIRLLLPSGTFSSGLDRELKQLLEEFNKSHTDSPVQIIHRGEDFSSLKELMALHLAGSTPEVAAIEVSEAPAIEGTRLALPPSKLKKISVDLETQRPTEVLSIPFSHTVPVLFVNQEMLYRIHADAKPLPTTWKGILDLAKKLAEAPGAVGADRYALALPLQGSRGLWIFEALVSKPLWKRQLGGIKSNRELEGPIEKLQEIIDNPVIARPDETWERAVQAFLDRKAALLVGSLDLTPYIAGQATFRWTAGPMPQIAGGFATLESGSHLVVTKDSPEIWDFIAFLYSPPVAARWVSAGGFLPQKSSWVATPQWDQATRGMQIYRGLVPQLRARNNRTTDPEVVRARSEWIRSLKVIFGERSKRLPTKSIFISLDKSLTEG